MLSLPPAPEHFHIHAEWGQLYDEKSWKPLTEDDIEQSETMQRAHFAAFFAASRRLRHPLPPGLKFYTMLQLVHDGLLKAKARCVWLRLHKGLKAYLFATRRLAAFQQQTRAERLRVLEEWLAFWRTAEAQGREELRRNMMSPLRSPPRKPAQMAFAQTMAGTPDDEKGQVLWDLYWLLQTQTNALLKSYWTQWFELLYMRRLIQARPPQVDTEDFNMHNEPVSLRAIDAALFIHALRKPKPLFTAGKDIKMAELLRLASAPTGPILGLDKNGDPIRQISPVVSAFQQSPLCRRRNWLATRLQQEQPVIPPRTWFPEGTEDAPVPFASDLSALAPLLFPRPCSEASSSESGRSVEHVRVLEQRRRDLRIVTPLTSHQSWRRNPKMVSDSASLPSLSSLPSSPLVQEAGSPRWSATSPKSLTPMSDPASFSPRHQPRGDCAAHNPRSKVDHVGRGKVTPLPSTDAREPTLKQAHSFRLNKGTSFRLPSHPASPTSSVASLASPRARAPPRSFSPHKAEDLDLTPSSPRGSRLAAAKGPLPL